MAVDIEWKSILFILKFYNSQWIAWLVVEYNVSSQKEYNVESNKKTIMTTKKRIMIHFTHGQEINFY